MTWYFVVLIVIGYFIMWIITSFIMSHGDPDPGCVFIGFLWPGIIAALPIVMSFVLVEKILNVLSKEKEK